jgi:hypothetical protein
MNKFYPLLTVITLCVIGVLKVVVSFRNTVKEQEFAIEFLNKYREFLKKLFQYNVDGELYQWLKLNGLKMQKRINVRGIRIKMEGCILWRLPGAPEPFCHSWPFFPIGDPSFCNNPPSTRGP